MGDICVGTLATFHVRNLSERNPIRVCGSLEDGAVEAAPVLQKDQRRLLHSGDVIHVNLNKGSTLFLTFRDLMAAKSKIKCVALPTCISYEEHPKVMDKNIAGVICMEDVVSNLNNAKAEVEQI